MFCSNDLLVTKGGKFNVMWLLATSSNKDVYEYLQYFFRKMSDKRRLVLSIIQFCQEELQSDALSDDTKESLEVIINTLTFHMLMINISGGQSMSAVCLCPEC